MDSLQSVACKSTAKWTFHATSPDAIVLGENAVRLLIGQSIMNAHAGHRQHCSCDISLIVFQLLLQPQCNGKKTWRRVDLGAACGWYVSKDFQVLASLFHPHYDEEHGRA